MYYGLNGIKPLKMDNSNSNNDKYPLNDFQKEILKKELDVIDNIFGKIDTIQMSLKNRCILIWGGSLYLISEHLGKSPRLILMTGIVPLLFGYLDLTWKKQILKAKYREEKISEFLNVKDPDKNLRLLDLIGETYRKENDFGYKTNFIRAFGYKGEGYFYFFLVILTILLSVFYKTI